MNQTHHCATHGRKSCTRRARTLQVEAQAIQDARSVHESRRQTTGEYISHTFQRSMSGALHEGRHSVADTKHVRYRIHVREASCRWWHGIARSSGTVTAVSRNLWTTSTNLVRGVLPFSSPPDVGPLDLREQMTRLVGEESVVFLRQQRTTDDDKQRHRQIVRSWYAFCVYEQRDCNARGTKMTTRAGRRRLSVR